MMTSSAAEIAALLINSFHAGHKLLICGNGGSAADAQHIAAEFVGRYKIDRRPLPALALASDVATLTAIANDYGYEEVFARQVDALAQPGDVLLAVSTSGRSQNVLQALRRARLRNITTVGFTGSWPSAMLDFCDHVVAIDSEDTAVIQQGYMIVAHEICDLVEQAFAKEP